MAAAASEFQDRTHPDTIVLFDVDGTLTKPRNVRMLSTRLPGGFTLGANEPAPFDK